jgi:teichuronic acid biosynthesis glycosyltransferase TuaC
MSTRLNVLAFTSLFRTPNEKVRAPFTSEFLRALHEFADVTLVSPIPWTPDTAMTRSRPEWKRYIGVPASDTVDGVRVHYPRYLMVPKLSGVLQPALQAMGAWSAVRALHRARRFDVINGRFIYPDGVAATLLGRRLGVPVTLTALGTDVNVYAAQPLKRAQTVWALRRAAHVSAVSVELADRIAALGIERSKISLAPNGIDLERFRPDGPSPPSLGSSALPSGKTLICVARLSQEKGLHVLMEALAILQKTNRCDFTTVLLGDGPERSALEARVAASGLGAKVRFAGEVDHNEVPAWMRGAHGFCLPSFREGTPNVVIEALASGLPVVATRVGGTPLLVNAGNGLLVEPGQAPALAEALAGMMGREWNRASIRATVAHMSWQEEARSHFALFERVAHSV